MQTAIFVSHPTLWCLPCCPSSSWLALLREAHPPLLMHLPDTFIFVHISVFPKMTTSWEQEWCRMLISVKLDLRGQW